LHNAHGLVPLAKRSPWLRGSVPGRATLSKPSGPWVTCHDSEAKTVGPPEDGMGVANVVAASVQVARPGVWLVCPDAEVETVGPPGPAVG